MLADETTLIDFDEFVEQASPRLVDALSAMYGPQVGRDAAADALAYGWEHWDRVRVMANPVGYLFVVGRDSVRRGSRRTPPVLMPVDAMRTPWVEPGLPEALGRLSSQQRTVVMLLHCYDWSMSEVADVLGVSKSAVQSHDRRGMKRLRRRLGVPE